MIQDGDETGVDCGGSCEPCHKLRILAVPLLWSGTQQDFDEEVSTQIDFFINSTDLRNCRNKVKVDKLSVAADNFEAFNCSPKSCGVELIKPYIRSIGRSTKDYDHIIGFTRQSPCVPLQGCSNGFDTAWVSTKYEVIAAHEIGHFYDLEDEYCSNQAGSQDPRCNDGGEGWWKGDVFRKARDINYLDVGLSCNASIGDCCNDCGSNPNPKGDPDYYVCCEGNVNSKGGKAIMSYANAPGPREFDDHSKAHLATFPNLQCSASKDIGIKSIVENKVIDLSLLLYNNDSIEKRWINLADGLPSINPGIEGDYSLLIKDSNDNILFSHSFEAFYDYSGPFVKGEDYSSIDLENIEISLKIGYDDAMYKIEVWDINSLIFEELLIFCNLDGICSGSETYLSCWQDCKPWSDDGICINDEDNHCDPDCTQGIDKDCKLNITLYLVKGWNLISIPLGNNSLDSISGSFSKIYTYQESRWIEIDDKQKINNTIGFWINMTRNDTLFIEGYESDNQTLDVDQGWNLVGYPFIQKRSISEMFENATVYSYRNSRWNSFKQGKFSNGILNLEPGYGYWIKTH
jgi:hypothetical protein